MKSKEEHTLSLAEILAHESTRWEIQGETHVQGTLLFGRESSYRLRLREDEGTIVQGIQYPEGMSWGMGTYFLLTEKEVADCWEAARKYVELWIWTMTFGRPRRSSSQGPHV
jgi:hypothetical protein